MKILVSSDAPKDAPLSGVGFFEEDKIPASAGKRFSGKDSETLLIGSTFFVGLGKKSKHTLEKTRRAAAKLLGQAKSLRVASAAVRLESFRGVFSAEETAGALVEGARLSDYRFEKYKSSPSPSRDLDTFLLIAKGDKVQKAVAEAEIISEGVLFTRDLANEPANIMTPVKLAQSAKEMAAKNGLRCRVLGKKEIEALKMGGLLGVSQGSVYPPQLIILENKVKTGAPVVLVGKGITFDTGGISIKPSNDMDKMKFDMCGAAAVIGAMKVVANLKLPVRVIGITPVCENMPGSRAQRPGDIIRCLNGKTVEVLNTDAEGRLILADALAYAQRFKPRAVVDIATLTGSCAATFADLATGLMGTDTDLVKRLKEAGEKTGERCWELPLWEEYLDLIKATYADIQNISKKSAGTITAGMFLREFTDGKPWAHLDIAGTAWNEGGPKALSPIGATGVGVRLFVEFLKGYSRR